MHLVSLKKLCKELIFCNSRKSSSSKSMNIPGLCAAAANAAKDWSLPGCWVSIRSYKITTCQKCWGRIFDLAWLKFSVAALHSVNQGPLKKWKEHSQELHLLKIYTYYVYKYIVVHIKIFLMRGQNIFEFTGTCFLRCSNMGIFG